MEIYELIHKEFNNFPFPCKCIIFEFLKQTVIALQKNSLIINKFNWTEIEIHFDFI